jgi:hypothetical protein
MRRILMKVWTDDKGNCINVTKISMVSQIISTNGMYMFLICFGDTTTSTRPIIGHIIEHINEQIVKDQYDSLLAAMREEKSDIEIKVDEVLKRLQPVTRKITVKKKE